jgi:hypothetical protein
MPNHCENNIVITGPEEVLEEIYCFHFINNSDDGNLDCNSIIPMPKFLEITNGTYVSQYADFIEADEKSVSDFMIGALSINALKTAALLAKQFHIITCIDKCNGKITQVQKAFAEEAKYLSNTEKYGFNS